MPAVDQGLLIRQLSEEKNRLLEENRRQHNTLGALERHIALLEYKARNREPLRALKNSLFKLFLNTRYRLGILYQYPPKPARLPAPLRNPEPSSALGFCLITPSYRQGQFIERTLRSVLDQAYPRLRYGVQDGGSDDETPLILQRYADRLTYHDSHPDRGQTDAINTGFTRLVPRDDEIMAWLNSDDILLPGTLAYVADYFARHPKVDVIYGHRLIIDEHDREVGRWFLPRHVKAHTLAWVDYVPQETLFWRASAWQRVGGLDPGYQFAMDWAFLIKLEDAGCEIRRLPRFLGGFRVHTSQKTHLQIHDCGLVETNRLRDRHGLKPHPSAIRTHEAVQREQRRSALTRRLWKLGLRF